MTNIRNQTILNAADRLEEMAAEMKEVVLELREDARHGHRMDAYGRLYLLRRELGYIVGTVGAGPVSQSLIRRIKQRRKDSQ